MKQLLLVAALVAFHIVLHAAPPHKYVRIITPKGECLLKLYDETPLHRDNFVKLVREGYYNDLLFHRVINHFMIQGGDPDSRYAAEKQQLGERSEEHTSELQSLMRISYAVFCLKKKKHKNKTYNT